VGSNSHWEPLTLLHVSSVPPGPGVTVTCWCGAGVHGEKAEAFHCQQSSINLRCKLSSGKSSFDSTKDGDPCIGLVADNLDGVDRHTFATLAIPAGQVSHMISQQSYHQSVEGLVGGGVVGS
jgi:hypothetical protein